MNGTDESDITRSEPCHVRVRTKDVGKVDVIDSGSGRVKIQNKGRNDGSVAVKLYKKMFIVTSEGPVEHRVTSEFADGCNTSHNCANGELHQAVPDGESTESEQTERTPRQSIDSSDGMMSEQADEGLARSPSPAADVKPAAVDYFPTLRDPQSTSANNCVLPAICDVCRAADDHRDTQLALSSSSAADTELNLSPLTDDVFARIKNRENVVNGEIVLVDDKRYEGGESGKELISDEVPAIHKESRETVRHELANCRVISVNMTSDNLPLIHNRGSETDERQKSARCPLPTRPSEGSEPDWQLRHGNCQTVSVSVPEIYSMGNDTDRNTNCQLLVSSTEGIETDQQHQLTNSRSPTVTTEGSETDRWQQQTVCSNLPKTDRVGIEVDRNTNRQLTTTADTEGNETDRCRRWTNCALPSVHKRQMFVDCDVNAPHSVWTSVVNHNSLSVSDDSSDSLTRSTACSSPKSPREVFTGYHLKSFLTLCYVMYLIYVCFCFINSKLFTSSYY